MLSDRVVLGIRMRALAGEASSEELAVLLSARLSRVEDRDSYLAEEARARASLRPLRRKPAMA